MILAASLSKSDNPVSKAQEIWKLLGQFGKIRSNKECFSGFLKHAGHTCKIITRTKFLPDESSTPALKSVKNNSWSYLLRYRSVFLLSSVRWFDICIFVGWAA